MFKEFKEFAVKGNVVDLAVGLVIGAAFGKIVSSFVADLLMPPIGLALGKVDFSNLYLNLSGTAYPTLAEAKKAGAPTINYGVFMNNVIDFMIVSFAVFLVVKAVNKLKNQTTVAVPVTLNTKACPQCISTVPLAAKRCPFCTSQI